MPAADSLNNSWRGNFMITILIISYLVFLCRGVPDSIIGAAWPLMYVEFGVSESLLSILTIGVSLFTAFASMLSTKIIIKFGTFRTLVVSLLFMALSVLGFGLGNSFLMLCFISVPLGFCAGVLDSTLNSYLAIRYKAVFLNLLHGFYGIGAILSPMLVSMAISYKNNWREGYFLAFYILSGVWIVLMLSLPMWKKASSHKNDDNIAETKKAVSISFMEQIKRKPIAFIYLIAVATNALEYSLGVWGSTFFTDARSISPAISASLITALYAGMTVGRLSGAFLSIKINCKKLLRIVIPALSVICMMLFFKLNIIVLYVLMFVFGMANGPIYPLMLSATPEIVGEEISQSVIGSEIAFAYIGCVLTHVILGFLVKYLSIAVLPVYVIAAYILMVLMFALFIRQTKEEC